MLGSLSRPRLPRRILLPALACLALIAVTGCDPCFGTSACVDPRFDASGHLVWHLTGEPAADVEVTFLPAQGSSLVSTVARVRSSRDGVFRFEIPSDRGGDVLGMLIFRPPEPYAFHGFEVTDVRLATTSVRGNPQHLGTWGVGPLPGPPHVSYVGELWFDDTNVRAVGVEVEFRRTGGIGVQPDTFVVTTDELGRFPLLMTTDEAGEVVGDILVRAPPPYRSLELVGLRMATLIGINESRLIGVWRLTR
jgi:hypothetical protein